MLSRAVQVWIILSVIWGTTWLVIRIGVGHVPPFTFAWLRFVFAIVPLLLFAWWRGCKIPREASDLILMTITGSLYFTLNYALVYWGEIYVNSGLGAILYTTLPLFSLVLSHLFIPNEKITPIRLGGVVIGIVGVCLIFLDQLYLDEAKAIWGALAIVVAALGCAVSGMLVKTRLSHMDSLTMTSGQMVAGLTGLTLLAVIFEGNPLAQDWTTPTLAGAAYLGILGTSVTFVLLNWLIHNMNYSKTQLIPFASTLIAVLLGWLVLNERIHLRIITGMICVLLGLAMGSNLISHTRTAMTRKPS